MNVEDDHFALFNLPRRFALDEAALAETWRRAQEKVHPDRYATLGAAERRVAMTWAARVNEAYRTLRAPVLRAGHLCELAGVPVAGERGGALDREFLAEQLAWREALAEAHGATRIDELRRLHAQVQGRRAAALVELAELLDVQQEPVRAAARVRELMFIEKFEAEVGQAIDDQEAAGLPAN